MTCAEVRDRLAEYALGVLAPGELRDVERHLEWCAGCRKESEELREGLVPVAMALPPAQPPTSLEQHVVDGIVAAAGTGGRGPVRRRWGIRALAAATMAAALLALGAVGWGLAERNHARDVDQELALARQRLRDVAELIGDLRTRFSGAGTILEGQLYPLRGSQSVGSGLVVTTPSAADFVFADVIPPVAQAREPSRVRILDSAGSVLFDGRLTKTPNGDFRMGAYTGRELEDATSMVVLDPAGRKLMIASLKPKAGS